jgi:hypothetical protein
MKKTTKKALKSLKIRTSIKAGGLSGSQHARRSLKIHAA